MSSRILLPQPQYDTNVVVPPLDLSSLASYLKRESHLVSLLDLNRTHIRHDQIKKNLLDLIRTLWAYRRCLQATWRSVNIFAALSPVLTHLWLLEESRHPPCPSIHSGSPAPGRLNQPGSIPEAINRRRFPEIEIHPEYREEITR